MFSFRNFFFITLIALLLTGYYAKVQREELTHQREVTSEKIQKITELKQENAELAAIINQKILDINHATEEFEAYKAKIAAIDLTPRVKIIFRDRVKEVPVEIVTQEANESSNEIIERINDRAVAFITPSVRDQDSN